jgi:FixJ family two-component response regulator
MPGMRGVKLQKHLIARGNTTPMIFITAFPEDRIQEQAMRAGAIGFLDKRFVETQLLDCVERALTRRRVGRMTPDWQARPTSTAWPTRVQDEFFLAAIAQNLRRLAALVARPASV